MKLSFKIRRTEAMVISIYLFFVAWEVSVDEAAFAVVMSSNEARSNLPEMGESKRP
jgi:hypothetical protein